MSSRTREILGWLFFAGLTFAVASVAAQFQPGEWYRQIAKPSWTPPGWIFPPVWTALYFAMATAAWLVWKRRGAKSRGPALTVWLVQLILNGLWSWLFFGQQMIGLALADIVLLLAAISFTTVLFWRQSTAAGWLFLPYLAWVGFATVLNLTIWLMN